MEAAAKGAVVLVSFPFSDLSRSKLRPAVVLADAGRGDHVLCQVTSKPYGDSTAVVLDSTAFASGSLQLTSYARPGKLFTASSDLMTGHVGVLTGQNANRGRRRRLDSRRLAIGLGTQPRQGPITGRFRSPTLRSGILRERRRASRLPSVPSALRGLDPRHALPMFWDTIGASARQERQSCFVPALRLLSKSGDARKLVFCRRPSASSRTTSFRSAATRIAPRVP